MAKEKDSNRFERLRKKFRLVAMDEKTFRENWSISISPMNVIVVIVAFALIIIVSTYLLIAYTGIKTLMPGYPDGTEKEQMVELAVKAQDMEKEINKLQMYNDNLLRILTNSDTSYRVGEGVDTNQTPSFNPDTIDFSRSPEDSMLRAAVEEGNSFDFYSPAAGAAGSRDNTMPSGIFFTPLHGEISQSFDAEEGHFGVDIVAPEKEAIKAALDGKVIMATWTPDAGNTIYLQHSNNLVSVYKHNSLLMKRVGDEVKAGEPIAVIGNTGELTTGPHLQFELWQNGQPIDPQDHIVF